MAVSTLKSASQRITASLSWYLENLQLLSTPGMKFSPNSRHKLVLPCTHLHVARHLHVLFAECDFTQKPAFRVPPPLPQAHVELNIPKEHHKFVIGGKGQKLKSIEVATGTKVKVPNADDSSDLVKIVGTREGVDKARHQIQVISDEQVRLSV